MKAQPLDGFIEKYPTTRHIILETQIPELMVFCDYLCIYVSDIYMMNVSDLFPHLAYWQTDLMPCTHVIGKGVHTASFTLQMINTFAASL